MQQFATALTRHLRALGIWAWSHLDNFSLAHPDPVILANVTRQFVNDLKTCGIQLNPKDTQKHPTQPIKVLGFLLEGADQMIGHTGTRLRDLATLLLNLEQRLPHKTVERFVGRLVFFLLFFLSCALSYA